MGRKLSPIRKPLLPKHSPYRRFDELDGRHPWQDVNKDGYILYRVRRLNRGEVSYFNFPLAKEMGLIPGDHPHRMTKELEQKLVQSFSIQIINEYDEISKKKIPEKDILPHPYMATRYLQLQHSNKKGTTSGDGRGIWNGVIHYRGKTWDVSSRGTGVTRLAPGSVESNSFLQTGSTEVGYGCGLAELDELLASSIMSETIYLTGVHTERTLCVIDIGGGYGIGVRAGLNLLRPAHIFRYLKQGRYAELKAATDYLIDRQFQNKIWDFSSASPKRYRKMAKLLADRYASFAAQLEADYIFAWMDWDGDNLLADAGILDYGSVRQFGLRHDQYRYDDIERFSTNLNEQKAKAKLTVQNFIQIADFLESGQKKKLNEFANHPYISYFDERYSHHLLDRFLYRAGFADQDRKHLLRHYKSEVSAFQREFEYFEKLKLTDRPEKLPDGLNKPALLNMRVFLKTAPQLILRRSENKEIDYVEFLNELICKQGTMKEVSNLNEKTKRMGLLLDRYQKVLHCAFGKTNFKVKMNALSHRAEVLNGPLRITGNALIQVVNELMWAKKNGLTNRDLQALIDRILYPFSNIPEGAQSNYRRKHPPLMIQKLLFSRLSSLIDDFSEDI